MAGVKWCIKGILLFFGRTNMFLQPRECVTEGVKSDKETCMCSVTQSSHLRLKFLLFIRTSVRTKLNVMKKYNNKVVLWCNTSLEVKNYVEILKKKLYVKNYHLCFNEIQKRELPFFGENTIEAEGNRSRQWGWCRERERGRGDFISGTTKLAGFSKWIDIICISKEYETGESPPYVIEVSEEEGLCGENEI